MTKEFDQYCNGIKNSFRLLAELKDYQEFDQFLRDSSLHSGPPTISLFILKPLEHIKNMLVHIQNILSLTSMDHPDHEHLSRVINGM